MNVHNKPNSAGSEPPSSSSAAGTIAITWAATSHVEGKRMPIGKIWVSEGKWPVTPAVARSGSDNTYAFEEVAYRDLDEFAADIAARIPGGFWTMIAGSLRPGLDLSQLQRRWGANFVDRPMTAMVVDVDGLIPDKGQDLSSPKDFGAAIVDAFRARLKARGLHSLAKAKIILLATASTGFPNNSSGEPAKGCARFRIIFETGTPLTLGQQKALIKAIGRLPSFGSLDPKKNSCLDAGICTPSGNIFVAAVAGVDDPIKERVLVVDAVAGDGKVDVEALAAELKLTEVPRASPAGSRKPKGDRVMKAPPEKREALLRDLMEVLPNEKGFDRLKWVGVAHALWGAADGADWAYDIFTDWSMRWPDGDDPLIRERMWNTLSEGENGIDYLLRWAVHVGTAEALEAVRAIELAAFPVNSEEGDDDDDDDDDDALLARKVPTIDPKAFYRVLGPIVEATTKESEATKVGVAAQTMVHVSSALRPFYDLLGDQKNPFNIFVIQVGLSAVARKGTSAAIANRFLAPAIQSVAREVQASLAFMDEKGMARTEAEASVVESLRKFDWTKSVQGYDDFTLKIDLDELRNERAEIETAIVDRKARLRSKSPALRTVREYEKLIAEGEAKLANVVEVIAAAEAELAAVEAVLRDPAAAIAQAKTTYDAALAKLAAAPPPAAPAEPWLALFAELAEPPVTIAGIGSGEGLIHAIRDAGTMQGPRGPVHDPGVKNKRLLIDQDEFGSTLAVIMRPGSTLSSTLRTLWDCRPTGAATKNSPVRCEEPYTVLSASITPGELIGRMFDKRDAASSADNGFGNRPLYLWTKRDKLVAHPQVTPGLDAMMEVIARNVLRVYGALKPTGGFMSTPIGFSPEAHALYELEYHRIAKVRPASSNAAKLTARLTAYLRKIAAILAVMNGEHEISVGALEAAIAWIDYAGKTIDAVAATAADRKRTKILSDDGETILTALKALGGDLKAISSSELRRKSRLDSKRFGAAIAELLRQAPPPIVLWEEKFVSGKGTERKRAMFTLNVPATSDRTSEADGQDFAGC